jgi:diaminohydroxyphosphoribosylaminopyrimidine deaminase/5-amino-6-(5-phosphoribosylamino)uracil reductase
MMSKLADYEVNELLVEAGSKLSGSLIREGLVDELIIYLAPCLIGDAAQGMLRLPELQNLSGRHDLRIRDLRMIGTDIRIIARVGQ